MASYGVCLGTPAQDIVDFAEWNDSSYQKVHCGPYTFRSGYRALDNFVDPTHFPFVHAGVNGVLEEPDPIAPYEVYEDEKGLSSTEVRVTQPYGDPRNVPVIAFYSYRIMRPLVAYLQKRLEIADPARAHEGDPKDRFCTLFTAQQVNPTTSIVRICCGTNFTPQPTHEDVRRRQDLVYAQDSAIVDSQRPERIPIDLRYELHHRSDLIGQKYRSWLKKQGRELWHSRKPLSLPGPRLSLSACRASPTPRKTRCCSNSRPGRGSAAGPGGRASRPAFAVRITAPIFAGDALVLLATLRRRREARTGRARWVNLAA
ncbi:MAG: hypothetical protein WDN49_10495 [Acetobacteraceae bacterium]